MVRRKGEQPIPVRLDSWHAAHPVADMIATGDSWFNAWMTQKTTPLGKLVKLTGIPRDRLATLSSRGGDVSRAEVDALARAWSISSGDLVTSIGTANAVIE